MRPVSLRWLLGIAVGLALVLTACSSPKAPVPAPPDYPVVQIDGFQAQVKTDEVQTQSLFNPLTCSSGRMYFLEVAVPILTFENGHLQIYHDVFWLPANVRKWNRELVLYAHGYVDPSETKSFAQQIADTPDLLEVRNDLLCQGYALAASEYSSKGFAVAEGVRDTHLLNAVFRFLFPYWYRRLDATYAVGSSLGGLVAMSLAENPVTASRYSGVMPTCGPIGGSLAEFTYIGSVRMMFGQYYSGVLQVGVVPTPYDEPEDWATAKEHIHDAIMGFPTNLTYLVNTRVDFTDPVTGAPLSLPLLQTPYGYGLTSDSTLFAEDALTRALRYHVQGAIEAMTRVGSPVWDDNNPFGTAGLSFVPWPDPTETHTIGSAAQDFYESWPYDTAGTPHTPVLTMHTPIDPDVPTIHEVFYSEKYAPNSGMLPNMLESYIIDGVISLPDGTSMEVPYGHCNFRPSDLVAGLHYLENRAAGDSWPDTPPEFESAFHLLGP